MSVIGRGRGRGRGAYQVEPKRPGTDSGEVPTPTPPQSPKSPIDQKDSAEQLASMVKTLSVGSSGDLQSISEAAKTFALTEGKYEEAVQMIYRRCYEDWRMSLTAAKLCNNLVQEIGNDFRSALLQVIQKDFRRKDELRQCFPSNFLGCISFLCQVFGQMKVLKADGTIEPFLPLIVPVYEALEMLLDNNCTDAEMECAVIQIFTVGKSLQIYGDSNKFRDLMRKVKDKVVDSKGSREIRKSMINLIECSASDWTLQKPATVQH